MTKKEFTDGIRIAHWVYDTLSVDEDIDDVFDAECEEEFDDARYFLLTELDTMARACMRLRSAVESLTYEEVSE